MLVRRTRGRPEVSAPMTDVTTRGTQFMSRGTVRDRLLTSPISVPMLIRMTFGRPLANAPTSARTMAGSTVMSRGTVEIRLPMTPRTTLMLTPRIAGRVAANVASKVRSTRGTVVTSAGNEPTTFRMSFRRSRTLDRTSTGVRLTSVATSAATTRIVVGRRAGNVRVSFRMSTSMTRVVVEMSRGRSLAMLPTRVSRTPDLARTTFGSMVETPVTLLATTAGSLVNRPSTRMNNRLFTSRLSTFSFVIRVVTTVLTLRNPRKPFGSKKSLNTLLTPLRFVRIPGFMTLFRLLNTLFRLDRVGAVVAPIPLVSVANLAVSPELLTPETILLNLPESPALNVSRPSLVVSASPLNLSASPDFYVAMDRLTLALVTPELNDPNGFASSLAFRATWPRVPVNGLLLMVRVICRLPPKHDPNRRRFARSDRSRLGTRPSPLASPLNLLLLSPLSALNMLATPLVPLLMLVNMVSVLVSRLIRLMTLRTATSLLRSLPVNCLTRFTVPLTQGVSRLPSPLRNGASRLSNVLTVGTVVPNVPCNDLSVSPLGFLFNWSRVVPMPVNVLSNALLVVNVVLLRFLRTELVNARKLTRFPDITLEILLEAPLRRPVSSRRMGMLESTSRSTLLFRSPFWVVMSSKTALTLARSWFDTRVALVMAPRMPATRLLDPTLVVSRAVVMAVVLFRLNVAFPMSVSVPPTTLVTSPVLRLRFPSPVRVPLTPRVCRKLFPVVSVATFLVTALTVLRLTPLTPLNVLLNPLRTSALLAPVVPLVVRATLFLSPPLKLPLSGVILTQMMLTSSLVTGVLFARPGGFDGGWGYLTRQRLPRCPWWVTCVLQLVRALAPVWWNGLASWLVYGWQFPCPSWFLSLTRL